LTAVVVVVDVVAVALNVVIEEVFRILFPQVRFNQTNVVFPCKISHKGYSFLISDWQIGKNYYN
jgi:hypothetical protein